MAGQSWALRSGRPGSDANVSRVVAAQDVMTGGREEVGQGRRPRRERSRRHAGDGSRGRRRRPSRPSSPPGSRPAAEPGDGGAVPGERDGRESARGRRRVSVCHVAPESALVRIMPASPTATAREPRIAMSVIAPPWPRALVDRRLPGLAPVTGHQEEAAGGDKAPAGRREGDRGEGGAAVAGRRDDLPCRAGVSRDGDVAVSREGEPGGAKGVRVVRGPRGAGRRLQRRPG